MQSTTNNDDRDQTEPQVIHREINSQLRRNKAKKMPQSDGVEYDIIYNNCRFYCSFFNLLYNYF